MCRKAYREAIRALKRAAKIWPDSLWLFSADGSLCLMKCGEYGGHVHTDSFQGGIDQEYLITTIDIDNDGGDW